MYACTVYAAMQRPPTVVAAGTGKYVHAFLHQAKPPAYRSHAGS